ncbi:hypothetical protein IWQ60_001224 [Tieghemiomyces parasiticus]|nr:hypothetical protein IWQ60_001224 [Tieghemiomyces parasiticus]
MGFGFFGRMYAMGLANRPFFEAYTGYAIYIALGGVGGIWYKGFKEEQQMLYEMRYRTVMDHRAKREAKLAAEAEATQ